MEPTVVSPIARGTILPLLGGRGPRHIPRRGAVGISARGVSPLVGHRRETRNIPVLRGAEGGFRGVFNYRGLR